MMGKIVKFDTLVGLRPAERVEAVELINNSDNQTFTKYMTSTNDFLALQFPVFVMRYYFRSPRFLTRWG
jgi:hypothetical protein